MNDVFTRLEANDVIAVELLDALDAIGYDFVTITPESHRRVLARPSMRMASDLRGVFGWSLPFEPEVVPAPIFALLKVGNFLLETETGLKSKVRVSRVRDRLFLHSAFPAEQSDSVFLGPDSHRFADFLTMALADARGASRLVDIGAGTGVGGITAARLLPGTRVELSDLNEAALVHCRINAAHAGVQVRTILSDGPIAIEPGFDLAIANPPFIFEDSGPAYRNGGGMHGAERARDWMLEAAARLAPGGRIVLYTGSPVIDGRDALREVLDDALPHFDCAMTWRELDPDLFGEELGKPNYAEVERIAAIGAIISK